MLAPVVDGVLAGWADPWVSRFLVGAFMPVSRGWAAAVQADGDLDRFRELAPRAKIAPSSLRRIAHDTHAYLDLDRRWQAAAFQGAGENFLSLTRARQTAANRYMSNRRFCLPAALRGEFDPTVQDVAAEAEVLVRHGGRLSDPAAAYAPVFRMPPIAQSPSIRRSGIRQYWLRVDSPDRGEPAIARVHEPESGEVTATALLLHGICVEAELWPDFHGFTTRWLATRGVRVIRPELPFHGHRCPSGLFGGEALIGQGPLAMLDFAQATVREATIWIDWARRLGPQAVTLGGISLGAVSASLILRCATGWDRPLQPDAAFLAGPIGDMLAAVTGSAIIAPTGLRGALAEAGWDETALRRWYSLLEPDTAPCLPPERIVVALGDADDVTPYADALRMVQGWGVGGDNLFIVPKGHFTMIASLPWNERALRRFLDVIPPPRS